MKTPLSKRFFILTQKILVSIVGPTAIGKTALSIALANHYKSEIISADSRQFYQEMQIGTAAPTPEELDAAPHHCIHHKSVLDSYNVGDFEKEALQLLAQLYKQHDHVIMVGGSGLYVDAVTKGLDNFPVVEPTIRKNLNEQFLENGLEFLQLKLKQLDPESYSKIAIDNPHRVIRALEICIGSGKPYSSYLDKPKPERFFKTITIGLTAERSLIYDRINHRVDLMMENGLLQEVKNLKSLQHENALNTVGYRELFNYLNGQWTLEFAVSEIKKNSRRYAKRQLTWFKKSDNIKWFDYNVSLAEIVEYVEKESI